MSILLTNLSFGWFKNHLTTTVWASGQYTPMGECQLDYKSEWRAHSQHFSIHLDGSSSFVTSIERYLLSSLYQGTSGSPVSEWTRNAQAAKQDSAPSRKGLGWYNWLITAVTGDADSWFSPEKLHDVSALSSGCFWSQKRKFICIIWAVWSLRTGNGCTRWT